MNYKLKKRQMKKLMILSTILLLGISSVFAQGAYDVVVPWDISNSDCQVVDQVNDRFVVFINIYDVANGIIVVDNAYNIEDNDADESTFDVQTEVQAHCNDGSLNNNTKLYKICESATCLHAYAIRVLFSEKY
jgi:hypothetical protein